MRKRLGIQDLRDLGGEWKAIRVTFNCYDYEGTLNGRTFEVYRRASCCIGENGGENWLSSWYVKCDGKHALVCGDPVETVRRLAVGTER